MLTISKTFCNKKISVLGDLKLLSCFAEEIVFYIPEVIRKRRPMQLNFKLFECKNEINQGIEFKE